MLLFFMRTLLCYPLAVNKISLTVYAVWVTGIKREHILAVLNEYRLDIIGGDYPYLSHLVFQRIPEILYAYDIPRFELLHIEKEVRTAKSAVHRYNAVVIGSADRVGGICKMSAACHHIIVIRAEKYGKPKVKLAYLKSSDAL